MPEHHPDRTALAHAYDGEEMVARLHTEAVVAEFQESTLYTVWMTPAGEDRLGGEPGDER